MNLNERELLAAIARKHSALLQQRPVEVETSDQAIARGVPYEVLPAFTYQPDLRRAGRVNYRHGGAQ